MVGFCVWLLVELPLSRTLPPVPLPPVALFLLVLVASPEPPVAVLSPVLFELLAELSTEMSIGVFEPPEPLSEPEL